MPDIISGLKTAAKTVLTLLGQSIHGFAANHGLVYAGNMAFLGMLSFFPFLIFLVAVAGFFGQTQSGQEAITFMLDNLPGEVAGTVRGPIEGILQNTHGEVLTASILFALWTAASGIEAARAAVNRAYGGSHHRPIWRRRLESLAIVFIAAISAIIGMSVLIIGPTALSVIDSYFELPEEVFRTWSNLRLWIGPPALFLALWGIYFALSPFGRIARRFNVPGTILALLVWVATAAGFSGYLKYARDLDVTYGGLAGVLIAQIFFFIVSIGFILGAEMNAACSRRFCNLEADQATPAE